MLDGSFCFMVDFLRERMEARRHLTMTVGCHRQPASRAVDPVEADCMPMHERSMINNKLGVIPSDFWTATT